MNNQELTVLFKKMLENKCSKEEAELLLTLLADKSNNRQLYQLIKDQLQGSDSFLSDEDVSNSVKESLDRRLSQILNSDSPPVKSTWLMLSRRRLWNAAAVIIFFISIGYYFFTKSVPEYSTSNRSERLIVAGRNKAILTLNNGQKINLDDMPTGDVATQANTVIEKSKNGVLSYRPTTTGGAPNQKGTGSTLNTITTPKGGQYHVILPDGSKVWLNAASSLKFPVPFAKGERIVELEGEGYFEIESIPRLLNGPGGTKAGNVPFIVMSNNQKIEVLGTKFNINAYRDESTIKTTLINGAVKVCVLNSANRHLVTSEVLAPGQQSENTGSELTVQKGNIESALAWKNGNFQFDNEDIYVVMRKIARWYNIEVEYSGDMRGKVFSGTISKYRNVNDVLKMLQLTGSVSFTIKDHKIWVF